MSVFENLNRVGRCTQCEAEIYDTKTQYPLGHPYSGEARTVGKSLPSCRVVTLILMSGHQCDITMCEKCVSQESSPGLVSIWKKLIRTWQLELTDEYRIINNSPILTPEQRVIEEKWFEGIIFNVPVGILSICKVGKQNG